MAFFDDAGNIKEALIPGFSTLNMFLISLSHSIQFVAPVTWVGCIGKESLSQNAIIHILENLSQIGMSMNMISNVSTIF